MQTRARQCNAMHTAVLQVMGAQLCTKKTKEKKKDRLQVVVPTIWSFDQGQNNVAVVVWRKGTVCLLRVCERSS